MVRDALRPVPVGWPNVFFSPILQPRVHRVKASRGQRHGMLQSSSRETSIVYRVAASFAALLLETDSEKKKAAKGSCSNNLVVHHSGMLRDMLCRWIAKWIFTTDTVYWRNIERGKKYALTEDMWDIAQMIFTSTYQKWLKVKR